MRHLFAFALAASSVAIPALAQDGAPPKLLVKELVAGMPKGDRQEVRVFEGTIPPGGKTPFHTHRFPLTVYILEGTFTLELEGRPPAVLKAGESYVEPANVKMTGYNKSANEPVRVLLFYVSDPGAPLLDVAH